MKGKKEIVYLVGDCGPEQDSLISIHKTYAGALKAWNNLRKDLLDNAKTMQKYKQDEAKKQLKEKTESDKESIKYYENIVKNGDEMYVRIIKALSEEDPKKIDNYPHETPYLRKEEVEP